MCYSTYAKTPTLCVFFAFWSVLLTPFCVIHASEISTNSHHPTQDTPSEPRLQLSELYPVPSDDDEWIELHNPSGQTVDTASYRIEDKAGNAIAIGDDTIAPGAYSILTATSVLNNSGDTVYLYENDTEIDTVTYERGLTNDTSYQYCGEKDSWTVSDQPSPGNANTGCQIIEPTPTLTPTRQPDRSSPSPEPTAPPSPSATAVPTPVSIPDGAIRISEVSPNPESGNAEWIELINTTDRTITLTDWQLDDDPEGGGKPFRFSASLLPNQPQTIDIPGQMLNNSGDTVVLMLPDGSLHDQVSYESSEKGMSWSRTSDNESICLTNPTPSKRNTPCPPVDETEASSSDQTSIAEPTSDTASTHLSTEAVHEQSPIQADSSISNMSESTSPGIPGAVTTKEPASAYPIWQNGYSANQESSYAQIHDKALAELRNNQAQYLPYQQRIVIMGFLAIATGGYAAVAIGWKILPRIGKRYWHSVTRFSILRS